jgi:hypothetical protein
MKYIIVPLYLLVQVQEPHFLSANATFEAMLLSKATSLSELRGGESRGVRAAVLAGYGLLIFRLLEHIHQISYGTS